ncbi:MAG TPA: formyltransferase family protein [Dehalococcoidia bacterium]|nr:formyltransferase family protein [Dehalococcoidia bacterium]
MTLQVGWFATARGAGSYNLLETTLRAIDSGSLDARIAFVFCNREPGESEATDRFFDLVRSRDIPLLTLSSVRFRKEREGERSRPTAPLPAWRREFDDALLRLVAPFSIDVAMLAGYMLIFTEDACLRLPLLNLHPAAPGGPAGTWQQVIRELIETRARRSGVTVFLATPEVDAGPPVTYCTFSLDDAALAPHWAEAAPRRGATLDETALFRAIRERGMAREGPLVVETLRAFVQGERRVQAFRVVDAKGEDAPPLDLTERVEAALAGVHPML